MKALFYAYLNTIFIHFYKENGLEDMAMFENKTGLCEDMKFLANMPELYDVTFLVGDSREPVGGIKAVLAARSRSHDDELHRFDSIRI